MSKGLASGLANTVTFVDSDIGSIVAFPTSSEPVGFLFCDGRAVSRTFYSQLFAKVGTMYGVGDGSTTFNLPDFRGQFLRGVVDISDITGSGTAASNQATFTAHGINRTGFKVRLSSGTLTGLSTSTDYYAIVVDSNTLAFATSLANAISNTRVAISGANSAVITQYEDPDKSSRTNLRQEDASQKITGGPISVAGDSFSPLSGNEGAFYGTNQSANRSSPGTVGTFLSYLYFDSSRVVRASNETRSKNVAVGYFIRYAAKLAIVDYTPVGTIIHSMLTEAQLQAQKGTGWILMDGRSVAGSAYQSITGFSTIPDARGSVLRAKNNGRADGFQNPDGDSALGTFQNDAFKAHVHTSTTTSAGALGYAPGANPTMKGGSDLVSSTGDSETRMKNITVNVFIKIN